MNLFTKLLLGLFLIANLSFQTSMAYYSTIEINLKGTKTHEVDNASKTIKLAQSEYYESTKPLWLTDPLPEVITGSTYHELTGVAGLPVFEIYVTYDIYEDDVRYPGPKINFNNQVCQFINNESTAEKIEFRTSNYVYTLTLDYIERDGTDIDCVINYEYHVPGYKVDTQNINVGNTTNAILVNGSVNVEYDTVCTAADYRDCEEAAGIDILPGKQSPLFNFKANKDHLFNGELTYFISDPALTERYYLVVVLQNGEEVLDRCWGYVNPPTFGNVRYYAMTSVSNENDCQVDLIHEVSL